MTPKEKAIDLVEKMIIASNEESDRIGKECALICVDEIIEEYEGQIFRRGLKNVTTKALHGYWLEVKQEINKL